MSSEKFNQLKKEIRSILITYQKGCLLSEFNHTYRNFNGKGLPASEFSYRTEIDLLKAMPDVVQISKAYSGDPYLLGIADETCQHVQNMVRRQKPAKLKPHSRMAHFSRKYYTPPRMHATNKYTQFNNKIPTSFEFSNEKRNVFQPNNISQTSNKVPSNSMPSTRNVTSPNPPPETKSTSAKDEVVALVKSYKNGVPLSEILYEYEQMYDKSLSLSDYGFTSIEECIENISELDIIDIDETPYAVHESESERLCGNISTVTSNADHNQNHESEEIPAQPNTNGSNYSDSDLPQSMMNKLQEVAKRYSRVIWSSEFPRYFEEVTHTTLDLQSLGYNCLADFIDDVPEIFSRKSVSASKKDYIIYPACLDSNDSKMNEHSVVPVLGALLIEEVIANLRQILQANPEGIKLHHLEHLYKINCQSGLHASDFGFRDLETFLHNIRERVPLRCKLQDGVKIVYLVQFSNRNIELQYGPTFVNREGPIPSDAASPKVAFHLLTFPTTFDFTKYVPVYVSSVKNPGYFYIQFQDDNAQDYVKLSDDIEDFYHGEQSSLYRMKSAHIIAGASCVALWPADNHWYRAQILALSSMDKVRVNYIDYGTKAEIPTSLLRYIKKEYLKLPTQALRCCLSYLKPAKNEATWSAESIKKFLTMCKDTPLMAKIEEITTEGVCSVVLCDTNHETDVYINDVLLKDGYADCDTQELPTTVPIATEPFSNAIPHPVPAMSYNNINPIQALQGHQYLLLFASVLPSFSVNEHYLKLLQQVAMLCSNNFSSQQNMQLPNLSSATLNSFSSKINANPVFGSSNPYTSMAQGYSNLLGPQCNGPNIPPIRPPTLLDAPSEANSTKFLATENKDEESEIFIDDDELFEKICKEVASKNKRYVKRVLLGNGYKIHIINYDDKAYASCGDISQLIWNNKEADFLFRRLQNKEIELPTLTLYDENHKELFQQLQRYSVKGIKIESQSASSILIYPLKVVIKILNVFGHPCALLRTKIIEEITMFDPSDSVWMEYSDLDLVESKEVESHIAVTDDDKIERLCLYDLQAIKEGINCRRLKIMKQLDHADNSKSVDEISKLEQMQHKVLQRIEEIEEICRSFS